MKEVFKNGAFLYLRLLVVIIMSFIVTISIGVLSIAAFTQNIGYTAYVTDKDGKEIDTYHFSIADGEDEKAQEYSSKGYSVNKVTERSQLKGKGAVVNNVASQSISLILLVTFIHNKLFPIGNSDGNLVRFGHKKEDKFFGLKVGLVSMIPCFIIFVVSVVLALGAGKGTTVSLLTLPNFYSFQILKAIIGTKTSLGALSAWQFVLSFLTLLIVPAISYVSYLLGYKDILILEKLTYKKKKNV